MISMSAKHQEYTVSVSVTGHIDVTVCAPKGASAQDLSKRALDAIGNVDWPAMKFDRIEPLNAYDENGAFLCQLFDTEVPNL